MIQPQAWLQLTWQARNPRPFNQPPGHDLTYPRMSCFSLFWVHLADIHQNNSPCLRNSSLAITLHVTIFKVRYLKLNKRSIPLQNWLCNLRFFFKKLMGNLHLFLEHTTAVWSRCSGDTLLARSHFLWVILQFSLYLLF